MHFWFPNRNASACNWIGLQAIIATKRVMQHWAPERITSLFSTKALFSTKVQSPVLLLVKIYRPIYRYYCPNTGINRLHQRQPSLSSPKCLYGAPAASSYPYRLTLDKRSWLDSLFHECRTGGSFIMIHWLCRPICWANASWAGDICLVSRLVTSCPPT